MKKEQIYGYIIEALIFQKIKCQGYHELHDIVLSGTIDKDLLQKKYNVKIDPSNKIFIYGRGEKHQIDAVGIYERVPNIYPLRLICECKHNNEKVGLPKIRDFVGVMKDISECYFSYINGKPIEKDLIRFTDTGIYYSTSGYTKNAVNYAYAHGILLEDIFYLNPHVEAIFNEMYRYKGENDNYIITIEDIHRITKFYLDNIEPKFYLYHVSIDGKFPALLYSLEEFPYNELSDSDIAYSRITYNPPSKEFFDEYHIEDRYRELYKKLYEEIPIKFEIELRTHKDEINSI